MSIESGHHPNRLFHDQAGSLFMNGAAFNESTAVASADGALEALLPNKQGRVHITKATAAALTIALPVAGDDDGKTLTVVSETAAAHVITQGTDGFNAKGSSGTVTFATTAGKSCRLYARNGHWWVAADTGITIA